MSNRIFTTPEGEKVEIRKTNLEGISPVEKKGLLAELKNQANLTNIILDAEIAKKANQTSLVDRLTSAFKGKTSANEAVETNTEAYIAEIAASRQQQLANQQSTLGNLTAPTTNWSQKVQSEQKGNGGHSL